MASRRLYIIGNGFDLFHGFKSGYWNFKDFVQKHDRKLYELLSEYFNEDELWSDFEGTLAHLDVDTLKEDVSDLLVSYGAEDWSDSYHHAYPDEIQDIVNALTNTLKNLFTRWIFEISRSTRSNDSLLLLDKEADFLNFNYTPTLETIYQVLEDNITYIHNKAQGTDPNLIIGHGIDPNSMPVHNPLNDDGEYDSDIRVDQGEDEIRRYFLNTYKDTRTIISDLTHFFNSLIDKLEIYILGHSLSEVDRPYFVELVSHLNLNVVKWVVSFYDPRDIEHHRDFLASLQVPLANVTFKRMNEIDSPQAELF